MESNTSNPVVSVGVPVYNGGKYLFDCLQSILNQTFQNWECVVVDNQSTDNSYEIAKEFENKDSRFKAIKNEHFVPLVDNWNNAFTNANDKAKYYKLVQADDWIYPEFFEKAVELFEKDRSIGVISSYRLAGLQVDGCGLDVNSGQVFNGKEILKKQLTRKLDISGDITTLFFSYEHLKKLDFYPRVFNGKYHIDTEIFYDICDISNVGFVFQVLSYTRRHPESQTETTVFKYNTFHQLNEAVLYRFKGDDPVLNRLYRKERLDYASFYFFNKLKKNKTYEWHKKHIDRWFTLEEYLKGILTRNKVTKVINKISKKLSRLFGSKKK